MAPPRAARARLSYSWPVQELHDAPLAPLTTFRLGGPADPADHRDHRRRGDRRRPRGRRQRHPAAGHRRRQQPGHRRQGLRRHRPAHRHQGLRASTARRWSWPPARTGPTPSPAPSRPDWPASSAWPASPAPRARPRSRTSARTARRSPRPSPRSSPTTAAPARPSPSRTRSAASPTATAASRPTPTATSCCASASRWRTRAGSPRPLKYAETARALGVEPGDRVPAAVARETVLKLRAGKGMVLDPEDHDTWSAGSFFTNPILTEAEFAAFLARVPRAPRPRRRAARLPGGRRPDEDLRRLADRQGRLHQGLRHGPGPHLHQAHPRPHQPRAARPPRTCWRWPARSSPACGDAFGVTLVNEPVTVGVSL